MHIAVKMENEEIIKDLNSQINNLQIDLENNSKENGKKIAELTELKAELEKIVEKNIKSINELKKELKEEEEKKFMKTKIYLHK